MIDEPKPDDAAPKKQPKAKAKAPEKTGGLWKPRTQAFLGTDEDAIAAAMGLPRDRVKMNYEPVERDGVPGVLLTGEALD